MISAGVFHANWVAGTARFGYGALKIVRTVLHRTCLARNFVKAAHPSNPVDPVEKFVGLPGERKVCLSSKLAKAGDAAGNRSPTPTSFAPRLYERFGYGRRTDAVIQALRDAI
jgi:hypothetical protein